MSHARRKFYDALGLDKEHVEEMLTHIKRLFKIEETAKKQNYTPEQRLDLRKRESQPIVDKMKLLCDDLLKKNAPSSKLGEAITYRSQH